MKKIDFYFDFGSPYSYLAHTQIKKFEKETGEKVNYMPTLVGGLHKLAGITAPAFIPLKAKYLIKDCKLWADKYKVKYQFNRYFPIKTLNLMRAALVAEKDNFFRSFVDKAFNAIWVDSINMNDDEIFLVDPLLKFVNFLHYFYAKRAGAENLNKAISENLLPFKVREDIRMDQKNEKKSKKKSLTSI